MPPLKICRPGPGTRGPVRKYGPDRAPHGFSWISLVMSIACDMRVILRQAYGVVSVCMSIKVETPLVINLSSAQILCDFNNSHN